MSRLYELRKAAAETKLDTIDPEWRSRFVGDWQRAEDFYRPTRQRLVDGGSGVQPPEYREVREEDPDEDNGFDSDLDGSGDGN